jgi:CRP-like cAMP-binding protein
MEKKGEIFNQLAIIADLLERANVETISTSVIFVLNEKDFNTIYEKITKKTRSDIPSENTETTFIAKIGEIEFLFTLNKNSV